MSIPAGLPSVFLPGHEQFTSYKSSLNELFIKMKQAPPVYTGEKKESGWSSMVSYPKLQFSPNPDDSSKVQVTFPGDQVQVIGSDAVKKTSEHRAAFEALKALNLLPGNSEFQLLTTPGNKRKAEGMDVDGSAPPLKSPKQEARDFKSLLQQFARKGIPLPEYRTVRIHNENFFSSVDFNGVDYKGTFATSKKHAEQNAAHMALYLLGHEANPPVGYNKDTDVPPKMFATDPSAGLKAQNGFAMPPPQFVQQAQFVEQRGSVPHRGLEVMSRQIPPQQVSPQEKPTKKSNINQLEGGEYKGVLATYTQRHKLELPAYNVSEVASGGFVASVTVSGVPHSGAVCPKKRSAESSAAHFALYVLKQTETVPEGFEEKCSNGTTAPPEFVPLNHKQKLHQFAQKEKLGSASYETTLRPDKSAISTVTIGMRHYTGVVATNKKLAEQNAAAEACTHMMATVKVEIK